MDKLKEVERKIEEFSNSLEEKFENKRFKNKFDKLKKNIEDHIDCEVSITILADSKFKEEIQQLEDENPSLFSDVESPDDQSYWQRYANVMTELNEYMVDVDDQAIYYSHDIEQQTPIYLQTKIRTIERLNPKEEAIKLYINSYGGDAYAMFATYDVIRMTRSDVWGIAIGQVMSAGAFILIGCNRRLMSRNSVMMLHDIGSFIGGQFKDMASEYTHLVELQNRVYQYLEEHSNLTAKEWEKMLERNLYLTPDKALEYGLIDEII